MPLKIAFIGYNNMHTRRCLEQLARDNIEQVEFFNKFIGRVVLKDGTVIEAILSDTFRMKDGKRYDQVFVAGPRFGAVMVKRERDIEWLWHTTMCSIIAEEFRFQYYDPDAKECDT